MSFWRYGLSNAFNFFWSLVCSNWNPLWSELWTFSRSILLITDLTLFINFSAVFVRSFESYKVFRSLNFVIFLDVMQCALLNLFTQFLTLRIVPRNSWNYYVRWKPIVANQYRVWSCHDQLLQWSDLKYIEIFHSIFLYKSHVYLFNEPNASIMF